MSSLLDSVTTAIISLDGKGRIRVFNAAAEKLFGLPRCRSDRPVVRGDRQNHEPAFPGCQPLWERLSDAIWAAGAAVDLEYDLSRRTAPGV